MLKPNLRSVETVKISLMSSLDTVLSANTTFDDNNLDSPTVVNFSAGETTSGTIVLAKKFSWGAEFNLTNALSNTIQDPSRLNAFGGDPEVAQFTQTLEVTKSLWKDFWGRDFDLQLKLSNMGVEAAEKKLAFEKESGIKNFTESYINVVFARELVLLQKQAVIRAKKRFNLIKKRVSDGLSLKVDQYRAEMTLLTTQEQLEQAKQNLSAMMGNLSRLLHRPLDESENFDSLESMPVNISEVSFNNELQNKQIDQLESVVAQKRVELAQAENQIAPDLNFVTTYQTNDFNAKMSETLSEGNLLGDRNSVTLALNFTWQLGQETARTQARSTKRLYNNLLNQLNKQKSNLQVTYEDLKRQLEYIQKNLITSVVSLGLAEKSLNEYGKLYRLGKVTLDQVIAGEEQLILSQRKKLQYLVDKLKLHLAILQTQGKIEEALLEGSK